MTVPRGWEDLLSLQKDLPDNAGLTCRDRFNSWKIMSDLIQFGPSYFSKFKDHLRAPEIIEAVLLVKVNSAVSADVLPLWLTMFKNVIFQPLLEWSRIKVIR